MENCKPEYIKYSKKLAQRIEKYKSLREQLLLTGNIDPELTKFRFNDYVKYTMQIGKLEEKREIALSLDRQLFLHNKSIISSSLV